MVMYRDGECWEEFGNTVNSVSIGMKRHSNYIIGIMISCVVNVYIVSNSYVSSISIVQLARFVFRSPWHLSPGCFHLLSHVTVYCVS